MIQTLCQTSYRRIFRTLLTSSLPLALIGCGGGIGDEGPDPGISDYPIAYVKRPTPVDNQVMPPIPLQKDTRDPLFFAAGGDLYLRTLPTISAPETNITSSVTQGTGDVKDVDVSFDGTKLVFSLRLEDPNPNDDIVPTWNIYEYDLETSQLHRILNATAEDGDDIDPHYLPDGRIIFSSTRQIYSKTLRLDEDIINDNNKGAYAALDEARNDNAFVLHVMDPDGTNLKQVSFNQSHDLDPTVLSTGEVIFTRWDNASGFNNGFSLYKMTPDGGNLQIVYGGHSHATGSGGSAMPIQFTQPRETMDGNLLVIAKPNTDTFGGGDIYQININAYVDFDRTISGSQNNGGQSPATINPIRTDTNPSLGGRYISVFPLWDGTNRMLVSKGLCQILVNNEARICTADLIAQNPTAPELPPAYNIWMYNRSNHTEKVIASVEQGMMYADVVAMQPRSRPAINPGIFPDPFLEAEGVGLLHIRSVYDLDGNFNNMGAAPGDIATFASSFTPADQRPARFLRVIKPVGLPDPDDDPMFPDLLNEAFGPQRNLGMREILGYAPIEPDGSMIVKVPANVPFAIEVLDAAGRRIGPRHRNWLHLQAGETLECNGCHAHPNNGTTPMPHGRVGAGSPALHQGTGTGINATLPFPMPQGLATVNELYDFIGQTMAQVRYSRCSTGTCTSPAANVFEPTLDVIYEDYWSDVNRVALNASINYLYSDLTHLDATTNEAPVSTTCLVSWDPLCRIIINYQEHIEPLWSLPRTNPNYDPMDPNSIQDWTCTSCHSARDAANALQIPAGQLNLTNNTADYPATFIPNAEQVDTYRELLFNSIELDLDISGPTPVLIDIGTHNPPMSANGALTSSTFFNRFAAGNTHEGRLTGAELRLIAEWLDIGAQYYNNPFDPMAPQN